MSHFLNTTQARWTVAEIQQQVENWIEEKKQPREVLVAWCRKQGHHQPEFALQPDGTRRLICLNCATLLYEAGESIGYQTQAGNKRQGTIVVGNMFVPFLKEDVCLVRFQDVQQTPAAAERDGHPAQGGQSSILENEKQHAGAAYD